MNEIWEVLKEKKVIFWGTSVGAMQAYEILKERKLQDRVACCTDNNPLKWNEKFSGGGGYFTIIQPTELEYYISDKPKDYVIVITSIFFDSIYSQLIKMGIRCEIYILLLYDPCNWKKGLTYTAQVKETINDLYEMKDPYTSRLLELILKKDLLNGRSFAPIEAYLGYGGTDEYFYDDIIAFLKEEKMFTLFDIGAYVGDSAVQIFRRLSGRICKAYAFEPNEENYAELKKKQMEYPWILPMKAGIGDSSEILHFAEKGPFFRISETGSALAEVRTLDELELPCEGKMLLKIDIEGSEMAALRGAQETIRLMKPCVAVCVYHRETDIYEIPKFLKSLVSEYVFFLRGGMHTVCYAIPRNTGKVVQ